MSTIEPIFLRAEARPVTRRPGRGTAARKLSLGRGCLERLTSYLELCRGLAKLPAAVLVDAHVAGQYGGTGQKAPWDLLADFKPGVPLILAGGLTPNNVAEAVRLVRPYAVDVASGVESAPGVKDLEKVRQFIDRARAAASSP